MTDVTNRLAETWADYVVALRSNEGFQEDLYNALVQALRDCAHEWRHADSIPKLAANVLADIVPLSQAAAGAYAEPTRKRIMDASFELYDLITECVAPEPG